MVAPLAIYTLLRVPFLLFFPIAPAFADFKKLPVNGWYFDLKGYQGSEFESIQYLPQCGSLGVGLGREPKAIGDRCNTATNTFKDSNELAAFYDLDGKIQPQLTNGTESCLCMGLQTASNLGSGYPDRAAICLWISAAGDLESIPLTNSVGQVTKEQGYIGNYLLDLKRSLLLCLDVDLEKIRADHANSTTPPAPLRDTNKIPACVACGNSSSTSVENKPKQTLSGKVTSAIIGTVIVVVFIAIACGGYKYKEVWSGPGGTFTRYR